jgi:hypothetical protein
MIELCGDNLKLKYRCPKPKGTNHASFSGNSGTRIKSSIIPTGLRRKPKGKSVMPHNMWSRQL